MTDQEREADIRLRARYPNPFGVLGQKVLLADVTVLLRRLDKARAEIARMTQAGVSSYNL